MGAKKKTSRASFSILFLYLYFKNKAYFILESTSNGNASKTKANESFDNGVFFEIEAK